MRWTATSAERAVSELDPALRVAGVGILLEHLATLGEIAEPSVWCAGTIGSTAAVLVCDPWRLDTFQVLPESAGSDRATAEGVPRVRSWPVAALTDLAVDPTLAGFTVATADGSVCVGDVPRSLLGPFVAHLIARMPTRRTPGLETPGDHS